jgi:glycosyltransferase XagB
MTLETILTQNPLLGYRTPDYLKRIMPANIALEFGVVPLTIDNEVLLIASHHTLSNAAKRTLENLTRYPIKVIQFSYNQVRQFQARFYQHSEPFPPPFPISLLLEKLSITLWEDDLLSALSNPEQFANVFSNWLSHRNITARQWLQLISLGMYIPSKFQVQATPINYLLEFLDIEPAIRRELTEFTPLWWINQTLYLGICDLGHIREITAITEKWPFTTAFVVIPKDLNTKLQSSYTRKTVFANPLSEEHIAENLFEEGLLSNAELQAGLTLKQRTGISLADALFNENHDLEQDWLKKKAELLDSVAVDRDDLPGNFSEVLTSLYDIIPYTICRILNVLPLNFMDDILIVGMSEVHPGALAILNELSGYAVEPRIMYDHVIEDWLERRSIGVKSNSEIGGQQVRAFLLAAHLVHPDQLSRLKITSEMSIKETFAMLQSSALLSDEDIAQVYAILFQTPYLSLCNFQIDDDLISRFSQTFLKENHLLPLIEYEDALWVAVDDPQQGKPLSDLAKISGKTIWPLVVPTTDLDRLMHKFINYAKTDRSNQQAIETLKYLIRHKVISTDDLPAIREDLFEKDQIFDRVIKKYQLNRETNIYQQFAKARGVTYLSLKPKEESRYLIDPLGNQIKQTIRQDPVSTTVARHIDHTMAIQLGALPFKQENDAILVAFAGPLYDDALIELSLLFDEELIPVIADRDSLDDAIERSLGKKNIGTLLVNAGMITRYQLNDALNLAENTDSLVGQALIHRGFITEKQLYSFLSRQVEMPLFDLSKMELNRSVSKLLTPEQEWEWGVLPLAANENYLFLGVIDPVNREPIHKVKMFTDLQIIPVLITENDFEDALERLYQKDYTKQSVSALISRAPENSAAWVLTSAQKVWLVLISLTLIGLAIWNFKNFLIGVNAIFTIIYMMMLVYKFFLVASAVGSDLEIPISDEEIAALEDDELPMYTILIPVYKEAAVLPSLLKSIEKLDYPKIKLDVKVLLEQDDEETINAFIKTNPPDFIKAVIVPTSLPKTKPKACNYGLIHAKGEYIVIFDAEDRPNRDQLKKVVAAFNKCPENVICMQAKLNYFNRQQNILTQWFSSEYSMWFDLFLPGLDARNVPIPLGGTSNHFKKYALLEAGAWDPHNMTEDADLGIRLYKLGYRTKIVDSTTFEEANSDVKNWIRQRSRWVKGYIQTWLVHMRHPFKLIRDIGLRAFFSFQMVIGGNIFTVIVNPLYWIVTAAWFLFHFNILSSLFPGPIYYLGAFSLFFGNFAFTYMNVAGAMRRGYYDLVKYALLSPVYWVLMSVGGWRGFLQLITKPHYWEKTIHGLASTEEEEKA